MSNKKTASDIIAAATTEYQINVDRGIYALERLKDIIETFAENDELLKVGMEIYNKKCEDVAEQAVCCMFVFDKDKEDE